MSVLPRHGSVYSYAKLHCTCQHCRRAWADYQRAYRERRKLYDNDMAYITELLAKDNLAL
jgi:hypothetical protein